MTTINPEAEAIFDRADSEAQSLVGAVVGDFFIKDRVKPGKRWLYVAHNARTGREIRFQGYQLVRLVRETVKDGGWVIMPNSPWRDEYGDST
ncbi:hypothetical protein [Nocardioides sp.]|uniref:hypothetical protein n=1 Tax=Nocardioides sp. TaxID=35761 RepID=UPI002B7709EA|nr:hypothetical protein [Nocardioides sp.]HSX68458.1 hypothetical protein [Nocardioides sp.]